MTEIGWTDYLRYRARLRKFDMTIIEDIVRYGNERYFDTSTDRWVVVGKHANTLVMIPYDITENGKIIPVTIHATTRRQINYRVKSARFRI
uniref:Uncharacterized protein n=1 Tax=Candidatus Kentrum sp. FW TaxID=2126338 RepID=A0A450U494_9GAMM|nr:MAG: hypothetical protein BECKFW1821C_GA0114237_11714 [Candidatus Kentron sp. FW]